jgi:N-acetyl-anhydromuramyl-L-alanine amidase AmpD
MTRSLRALALGLAACVSAPLLAADRAHLLPTERFASEPTPFAFDTDPQLTARLAIEEQALRAERAAYPALFAEAYRQYPEIPAGTLEAIAFVQSRWQSLRPEAAVHLHHHQPAAHGLMGLYAGEGFIDQVGQAAKLLGVPRSRVALDPRLNVLGAAALLAREIRRDHGKRQDLGAEDIADALARYAGFAPAAAGKSAVQDFARASFAFDVLLTLDRGVNEKGVAVPERPVAFERAFDADQLVALRAPFVRLDMGKDRIEVDGYALDPISETLVRVDELKSEADGSGDKALKSTDYGPALWTPAHSTNYTASRSASVSAVTIHTAQGSYGGTISWFQNSTANVSAHYVIRSSDGQVTQMVREAHTAWHVRNHNSYTLGIEHEGYVSNSAWYTNAMYNASAALVRHFCARYAGISCSTAYSGPSSSGVVVLPDSVKIKGHQHFSGNTHTDPGINWDWRRYYGLLNPATSVTRVLDSFESSAGHFTHSPAYSGSTVGISTASTAQRHCTMARVGSCSLQVRLVDNPSTSANWSVRLLSGGGSPSANVSLAKAGGRVGFWVYSGGSGLSAALGVDDSDGTERSIARSIPANTWTWLEWRLDDSAQWNAWVGGNGVITASSVTLDAIWLYRAQTSYDVYVYIDQVQITN